MVSRVIRKYHFERLQRLIKWQNKSVSIREDSRDYIVEHNNFKLLIDKEEVEDNNIDDLMTFIQAFILETGSGDAV